MTSNHEKFLSHLRDSFEGVFVAVRWLNKLGYDVTVKSSTEAKSHSDWKDHADGGDIFISQRIEVKKLGVSFTKERWPFGENFIVCAKHAYDLAKPKPYAYLYLSADRKFAAILKGATRPRWSVQSRTDSRYENVEQEFYFAPLDCVRFFSVAEEG